MRVFVTGATGFIGSAIVKELIEAGHQVTGLARSEASAANLTAAGAQVHRGVVEDLDCLRLGAAAADGVIHTAVYRQTGHMPLGTRLRGLLIGLPTAIVSRFLPTALSTDRSALETMGRALVQLNRPLVAAFETLAMTPGKLATENDQHGSKSAGGTRGGTEATMRSLAAEGVRTSIIRLPPIVHGEGDQNGLLPMLIEIARKKGESAYVGDGFNRWPSVHKLDAARLFRLALENGTAGAAYHGVAEVGIPFREIATALAERLKVPVVSKSLAQAAKQFSFLSPFVPVDNPTSSKLTQERLGWHPQQAGLLADLDPAGYFKT